MKAKQSPHKKRTRAKSEAKAKRKKPEVEMSDRLGTRIMKEINYLKKKGSF